MSRDESASGGQNRELKCYPRPAMQPVCAENRVEQVVPITKNAAQACDTGGGQGTNVRRNKTRGVGPPPAFRADGKPSRHFSALLLRSGRAERSRSTACETGFSEQMLGIDQAFINA